MEGKRPYLALTQLSFFYSTVVQEPVPCVSVRPAACRLSLLAICTNGKHERACRALQCVTPHCLLALSLVKLNKAARAGVLYCPKVHDSHVHLLVFKPEPHLLTFHLVL